MAKTMYNKKWISLLVVCCCIFSHVHCYSNNWDLCALGHTTSTLSNYAINGNYTFRGYDMSNSNKPYWKHNDREITIEWGAVYGQGNRYMIKVFNESSYYGYCLQEYTLPHECNYQWLVWDGSAYQASTNYQTRNCSYFEMIDNENECRNKTHLSLFGISEPFGNGSICFVNPYWQTNINGSYTYLGCSSGFPYYQNSKYLQIGGYYLYWSWQWAYCM